MRYWSSTIGSFLFTTLLISSPVYAEDPAPQSTDASTASADTGSLTGDKAALSALFNATNGPGWESNDGWNSDNVCAWEGVTCTGTPERVTELNLASRNLLGQLPPDIQALTALQTLDLRENDLNGSIPAEIGSLKQLQRLKLDHNHLEGALPSELAQLTNLKLLHLHSNLLTGDIQGALGPLAATLNAGSLDLRWNGLHADNATIDALNAKQKGNDILATQTLDATGLSGEPGQNSILVSWTPVAYQADPGGYEIRVFDSNGSKIKSAQVAGKETDNFAVTGLNARTRYFIEVRSFTEPHANNDNKILSDGLLEPQLVATTSIDLNADEDNDGINNRDEGYPSKDTDNDNIPDYIDPDDDNDGVDTKEEKTKYNTNPLSVDSDEDGIWDVDEVQFDADNDGIIDALEKDDDGDGVLTKEEVGPDVNKNGRTEVAEFIDTDGDHIPNHRDDDDDGDGKPTKTEVLGDSGERTDSDGDTVYDFLDPNDSSVTTSIGGGSTGLGFIALALAGLVRRRVSPATWLPLLVLLSLSAAAAAEPEQAAVEQAPDIESTPAPNPDSEMLKPASGDIDFATKEASLSRGGRGYLGIGAGATELDPDTGSTGFKVDDGSDVGAKLLLGYEITDHFSIEFSGGPLGEAKLLSASNVEGKVDYVGYSAYAVYNVLRPRKGFNPILKLGVSQITNDASANVPYERDQNLLVAGGIGLEYEFENQVALRGEYEYLAEDAQMFSLNLIMRFGGQKTIVVPPAPAPVVIPAPAPSNVNVAPPKVNVEFKIPDTDGDGVNDIRDACPNTPAGAEVDELGCAKFQGVLKGVNFEYNSARLTPQAKAILVEVAEELKQYPSVKVEVQAHTDSTGSSGYNLWLSERRARSVIDYLTSLGISSRRLIPVGFGETKPIASNATEAGRAANRRVQFEVLSGQ